MIVDRTRELARFDLAWWVEPLQPVLEQFVAAASGVVDADFWRSFVKWKSASGSSPVSGWVLKLFPYLRHPEANRPRTGTAPLLRRNPWLAGPLTPAGPEGDEFPSVPAKAPFTWHHLGRAYPMEFVGGLIGVAQHPVTLCLRPEIGWIVAAATTT
jgi:hypothetical protein